MFLRNKELYFFFFIVDRSRRKSSFFSCKPLDVLSNWVNIQNDTTAEDSTTKKWVRSEFRIFITPVDIHNRRQFSRFEYLKQKYDTVGTSRRSHPSPHRLCTKIRRKHPIAILQWICLACTCKFCKNARLHFVRRVRVRVASHVRPTELSDASIYPLSTTKLLDVQSSPNNISFALRIIIL